MKKIAAVAMAAMVMVSLTACGDKSAEKDLSKVTLEDIEKANNGENLLDNYKSVQYKMQITEEDGQYIEEAAVTEIDGEYCYSVKLEDTEAYRNEVFKDGYIYSAYGDTDGVEYAVCWFMDGEYENYLNECVQGFLVADTEALEITEVLEKEDYVSVTAQIDEGDNVSEEYDYFYEYVMDKEDLSITQFVAYATNADEEKSLSSFAEVTYDEEFTVPSFVNTLQKADTRTVKVIVDPGKDSEKVHEVKIAGTAVFDAVLSDGYTLYSDKNGKTEYTFGQESPGEKGNYPDMTVYAIK